MYSYTNMIKTRYGTLLIASFHMQQFMHIKGYSTLPGIIIISLSVLYRTFVCGYHYKGSCGKGRKGRNREGEDRKGRGEGQ